MVSIAVSTLTTQAIASPVVDFTALKTAAANASSSLFSNPSFEQIIRFPFRFATRLDRIFIHVWNNYILATFGLTGNAGAGGLGAHMADAQPAVVEGLAQTTQESWAVFFAEAFQASTFKSYWGMLHYLTSRWAFTCFAMALILNRIGVYGASRQRIRFTWSRRLALRIVPILLLTSQVHSLLQAIRCQTSPNFSLYRHGDNNKYSLLDWSSDGGALHTATSTILFRSTDADACAALGFSRPEPGVKATRGSFSLLWPAFLRLSLAHAVESLSCTLQQVPSMTEVGMSVFEHSLAFAEAETMISHTLGLGLFGNGKSASASKTTSTDSSAPSEYQATIPASGTILAIADATTSLTNAHYLDRVNVPVEVLLVTLLSCLNALSSHIIAVLGKQRQLRLINTGIWGIAFMGSFVWGLLTTSVMVRSGEDGDDRPVSSLLHFPTVAIVGFLPHMCIIFGIGVCLIIYSIALVLTAVSLSTNPHIPQPTSFKQRFSIAHDNLQAAVQTRGINIRWYEDFYTALLRIGFAALTAASEAVFLNEGRSVEVRQFTWLEEDRLDEFETMKLEQGPLTSNQPFQILEEYGLPPSSPGGTDKGGVWESGFAKERKFEQKESQLSNKDSFVYPTPRAGGVGAVQRTTRFYLLMIYLRGILFLIGGYFTYGLGLLLDSIGITSRPRWLRKLVGRSLKKTQKEKRVSRHGHASPIDSWMFSEDGRLFTAGDVDVDIEPEMRLHLMTEFPGERVDELLDSKLYDWWKGGGWFGTKDESDDYRPPADIDNDDTTSMISMSTAMSESYQSDDDNAWESEPEGQRTPTQSNHAPAWSFSGIATRESTPDLVDSPFDPATLARLLNPQDKESRDQARILASHLASPQSSGIITRSRYRREQESERAKILLAGRRPHPSSTSTSASSKVYPSSPNISLYNDQTRPSGPRPLTTVEESEVLESLILTRRKKHAPPPPPSSGDADDDANRQAGPPCVVCQTAGRTIIAWPCRCLCVCEDCRVSLALNNFGNCVTCRRAVQGFVRLYVP